MADFTVPSFSLGLDFDIDSVPQIAVREDPPIKQARESSFSANLPPKVAEFDYEDSELPTMGEEQPALNRPRTLKRLRRGPTTEPAMASQKLERLVPLSNVDDDIEEFSSQEDKRRDEPSSTQYQSMCSSSKLSLPGHGILTKQSLRKKKKVSNDPGSSYMETSSIKLMFPKLTVSPLRRFQLIDSDSDDSRSSDGEILEANKAVSSVKESQFNHCLHASSSEPLKTKAPASVPKTQDLWDDLCSEKNFHIPTPALDEVCEEYFRSIKDKKEDLNNTKGCYQSSNINKQYEQHLNLDDPLPPAHRYFFHDDQRIQKLVRNRLPNFFLLGAANSGYKQSSPIFIDYMGQFSHGDGSKRAAGNKNTETSSTSKKRSNKTNAGEVSQGSGSWVNPKCSTGITKDAGKRRVHAVGQSSGHWYTASNGKRVYVNKTGQELRGQNAYRNYRKESGAKSKPKRPRKKTAGKKK